MDKERAEEIEEEYGMPPGRLMYHLYHEEGMSQYDIGQELDAPRETVRYWLQRAGIKTRSRALTDTQRILIMAYLSAGIGLDSAASKADCGRATVQRYRKEIQSTGKPVDLDRELSSGEWEILCEIIEDDIAPPEPAESSETTSEAPIDST